MGKVSEDNIHVKLWDSQVSVPGIVAIYRFSKNTLGYHTQPLLTETGKLYQVVRAKTWI